MKAPQWLANIFSTGAKELASEIGEQYAGIAAGHTGKKELALALEQLVVERFSSMTDTLTTMMQAKERILVAELTQEDPWTKRARPMVVYAGLAYIAVNYVIGPWLALALGSAPPAMPALPTEFWWAWGGICGTWAVGRSAEKMGANGTIGKVAAAITGGKKAKLSLLSED